MSESEPKVKITDKRMFTADGELREDYQHLDSAASEAGGEPAADDAAKPAAEPSPEPVPAEPPPAETVAEPPPEPAPSFDGGRLPADPGFLDLVSALAEPIALFLGDVRLPDGRSTEDLEAARFHIDLLEVVKQKTAGNLSAEESSLLEDLLYRLRLRYVQKSS